MLLDQKIDVGAAGENHDVPVSPVYHPVILIYNDGGPSRGLLGTGKPQNLQGLPIDLMVTWS
jgi:hypothetical protein